MNNLESVNKNATIVGLIGEKIVSNYLGSLGLITSFSIDPYSPYDMFIKEGDEYKSIQVKTTTPYFKYNMWSINFSKTAENIVNLFKANKLFVISLPADSAMKFGFKPHKTDGCLIEVDVSKLTMEDNISQQFKSFVLHRDNHSHMYKIVRRLSDNEITILHKYPTSKFS